MTSTSNKLRLLIDLQDCQIAFHKQKKLVHPLCKLTQTMAEFTKNSHHEIWILLNNQLADTIEPICYLLSDYICDAHIYLCDIPLPKSTKIKSSWSSIAHGLILQQCFNHIKPSVVVLSQPALTLFSILPDDFNQATNWVNATLLMNRQAITRLKRSPTLLKQMDFILLPANKIKLLPSNFSTSYIAFPIATDDHESWQATTQSCLTAVDLACHHHSQVAHASTPQPNKAKLAYLSPIWSNQTASSITHFTQYYEVTYITNAEPACDLNSLAFTVESLTWFHKHSHQFDYLVYDFDNHPIYAPLLNLLLQYPGTVITGDFHFDQLYVDNQNETSQQHLFDSVPTAYHAQGYLALQQPQQHPCQHQIFSCAVGIITHESAVVEPFQRQYGNVSLPATRVLPALNRPTLSTTEQGKIIEQYCQAIEEFHQHSPLVKQQRLITHLAELATQQQPLKDEVQPVIYYLACHFVGWRPPQLLIDISLLAHEKTKTGVGRVLSCIVEALLKNSSMPYRVEPIYYDGQCYRYARKLTAKLLGISSTSSLEESPIEVHARDILLILDIQHHRLQRNYCEYQRWRNRGANIYFIIYDLIPYLRPEVFTLEISIEFKNWLATIAKISSGLICDSRAVADELHEWLQQHNPQRYSPLTVGYFHLGADMNTQLSSHGQPDNAPQIMQAMQQRPSFIMVSTIEPRKGHAQALAAFEQLWRESMEVNLIIVGKQGWLVDALMKQIQQHPELHHRLFWLGYVSDGFLEQLYAQAAVLLVASEAEGFGLPLIEAARHNIPLLIRDLPVFREIAGDHAFYFTGQTPADLATAIKNWLALFKQGSIPTSSELPWLTWQASTQRLLQILFQQRWYFTHFHKPII